MSKATKQAAESDTKKEPSSTPTPSPPGVTEEPLPVMPKKLIVPHSVQFLQPTEVKPISAGNSYQQVSRSQCRIIEFPDHIILEPHDPRNKFTLKVPKSSLKGITYETIDAS